MVLPPDDDNRTESTIRPWIHVNIAVTCSVISVLYHQSVPIWDCTVEIVENLSKLTWDVHFAGNVPWMVHLKGVFFNVRKRHHPKSTGQTLWTYSDNKDWGTYSWKGFSLLWIKKTRATDKTYIWESVWWKTHKLKLRNLYASHTLGYAIPAVIHT